MISRRGIAMFMIVLVLSLIFDQFLRYSAMERTSWEENKKLPPGPAGIPVFGSYFSVAKDPVKKLNELGKEYGNTFGLYIGPQYVVVLNDWEALKEGLDQSASSNRPPHIVAVLPYKLGFVGTNGPEWAEGRQILLRTMKDVGLYSSKMVELMQEGAHELVQKITKCDGQPLKIREFIVESVASVMVKPILGKKLDQGNSNAQKVIKGMDAILKYNSAFAMFNFSPKLAEFLQFIGYEKEFPIVEGVTDFIEFVSNAVDECRTKKDDSFISGYYKEIENQKHKTSYMTADSLKGGVIVMLSSATEGFSSTLVWALLAMANFPDVQQKVHEELDRVIGKNGSITWADRFKIPYTYATLLESMRYSTLAPLLSMRMVSEDMYVQGYFIPKGTFITGNIWAIHNDPKYWDEPDEFNPERFLIDDGMTVNTHPESFSPLSYGKRGCPGRLLTDMAILQYFTILMQNFKVLPKEGDKVKYCTTLGLTYEATNVELRFIKRL